MLGEAALALALAVVAAAGPPKRLLHQLTKPMDLGVADILHAAQNNNVTLSPVDGRVRAIVRHMGDPDSAELAQEVAHPVRWNVSALTGVAPDGWADGAGQRGYRDEVGSNAFQVAGREFASWINSSSWTHSSPVRGGGPQAQLYAEIPATAPRPWATEGPPGVFTTDPRRLLALEVSAKLPVLQGKLAKPNVSGADAQFGLGFYAHDTVSKKSYVGGGNIWDSRPFGYQCGSEFIGSDTFTPFASSPILNSSKYSSPGRGSAPFTAGEAWSEWRWYKVTVSAAQMELAARDINAKYPGTNISENAADYQLSLVLLGNEVAPTGAALDGCPVAYSNAYANFSAYIEHRSSSERAA